VKFVVFIFGLFVFALQTQAAMPIRKNPIVYKVDFSKGGFPPVPALSKGQYAVFIDDAYQVFTTQKHQNLEISSSCFKGGQVLECQAFQLSKIKPPPFESPHELMNNSAALNCLALGAKSLTVLDDQKRELTFCRFPDKSLISAWSLYYKHHPRQLVR